MSDSVKIKGTDEAWESRELGADENFVRPTEIDEQVINDAAELQMISIRLQKSLIEDFKLIAKLNGIGYQTLMRQTLKRFANCEMKRVTREYLAIKEQEEEQRRVMEEMAEKDKKDKKDKKEAV